MGARTGNIYLLLLAGGQATGHLALISCVKTVREKNKSMKFQGFLPDSSGFVGKIWPRDSLLTPLLTFSLQPFEDPSENSAPNVHKTLTMLQVIDSKAAVT